MTTDEHKANILNFLRKHQLMAIAINPEVVISVTDSNVSRKNKKIGTQL